jgi:hypothetical protein
MNKTDNKLKEVKNMPRQILIEPLDMASEVKILHQLGLEKYEIDYLKHLRQKQIQASHWN